MDGTVFQHNWFSSFSLIFYLRPFKNIILQGGAKIAEDSLQTPKSLKERILKALPSLLPCFDKEAGS